MLERFTDEARDALRVAQQEALRSAGRPRRSRAAKPFLEPEHLLLGLLAADTGPAADVLHGHGLTPERVRDRLADHIDGLDAQALATLGIDLDAVRRSAEASFGPGALEGGAGRRHIAFSVEAKRVLALSLRVAVRLGHHHITTGHVLLGLLQQDRGPAVRALRDLQVDIERLDAEVTALISDRAA
jgi:ATP-dependent Clp protease ATP-binding subunit ClpA